MLQNLVSLNIFRQEKRTKIKKVERMRPFKLEEAKEESRKGIMKAQRDMETRLETTKQTVISLLGSYFCLVHFFR